MHRIQTVQLTRFSTRSGSLDKSAQIGPYSHRALDAKRDQPVLSFTDVIYMVRAIRGFDSRPTIFNAVDTPREYEIVIPTEKSRCATEIYRFREQN